MVTGLGSKLAFGRRPSSGCIYNGKERSFYFVRSHDPMHPAAHFAIAGAGASPHRINQMARQRKFNNSMESQS
jgi:hypothetical protein